MGRRQRTGRGNRYLRHGGVREAGVERFFLKLVDGAGLVRALGDARLTVLTSKNRWPNYDSK